MLEPRASGLLLHPTSLPGPHGSGDLGPSAHAFVDFLHAARQRYWQMLPIHPTGAGSSPYSALSAFAGNPLLISPEALVRDGLLSRSELGAALPSGGIDYARATRHRQKLLRKACARVLGQRGHYARQLATFLRRERAWLHDYTLFMALRTQHAEVSWLSWDADLRTRDVTALRRARRALADEIAYYEVEQWLFDRQWRALKEHALAANVRLIGDIPIFVSHDSADVWAGQHNFQLERSGRPRFVSGVPPDYFSSEGQRWGTPVYDWKRLKADGYAFWLERLGRLVERFDLVRLDHFIGFVRYWRIPDAALSAKQGSWKRGPGRDLFEAVASALGGLPFIAEDLGAMTPEVEKLRMGLGLPGMRVLQFAFNTDAHDPFLPHNYPPNCVAYTGTHDNDTTVGFLRNSATSSELSAIRSYLGLGARASAEALCAALLDALLASQAELCIVPLQDVLGLGSEARMNLPGRAEGNWTFRLPRNGLSQRVSEQLAQLSQRHHRS